MATTIITKYGSGAPTASDVVRGELAVDTENKRLYTEDSGGSVVEIGTNPAANVTFGDNVKAVFGAGSDLQIYHDGSHSYVSDQGTGSLFLQSGSTVFIQNSGGTANYFKGTDGGAAELFHSGSSKLATTSTGIDVTGTVTADGLTVSTSGTNAEAYFDNGSQSYRLLNRSSDNAFSIFDNTSSAFRLTTASNGDISFYEDTGTTAKLFWDASAESLGIGHSNPSYKLDVRDSSSFLLFASTDATTGSLARIRANGGSTEVLEIQASGNVGIGTSSPGSLFTGANKLVIGDGSGENGMTIYSGTATDGNIYFADGTTGADAYRGYLEYSHSSNYFRIGVDGTERIRIDSSGVVKLITANDTAGTEKFLTFGTNSFNRAGIKCTNAATYDGSLEFYTGNSTNFQERARVDKDGNLLVGTTTSPAANTPPGVRYGPGYQAGTLSSDVTISANTVTNVIDMADAMVSDNSGPGLYLVSIVRHSNSYGTNFVGIFGANNAGQTTLYDTLISNGITISVSGTSIQISSATADTYNTNVIPLSIDGG